MKNKPSPVGGRSPAHFIMVAYDDDTQLINVRLQETHKSPEQRNTWV